MEWQTRRKFLYALAGIIITLAVVIYLMRDIVFPAPTCSDNRQNGYEAGVDCGGICDIRCSSEVAPLVVLWSRAIPVSKTTYDLVAMVSNKNIDNAAHSVSYIFTVYDSKGLVLQEIKGDTLAPVDGDFPIIKQSITLSDIPREVTLQIKDSLHYRVNEKPTSPTVRISNEQYEAGSIARVYATLQNTKRMTILNLPVRVVLYDQQGNVFAAGETTIPRLEKEEVKDITFIWHSPLPYAPTRIRVYPIFDPFLSIE
jgi:hypothetical protein